MTDIIEITPGMIEAGKHEIASRWLEFTSCDEGPLLWDEVLTAVYRAMTKSRRESGLKNRIVLDRYGHSTGFMRFREISAEQPPRPGAPT